MRRRPPSLPFVPALTAASALLAAAPAAALTVEFALEGISVSEDVVRVAVLVTISQPPGKFAAVYFRPVSGTAVDGSDFSVSGASLSWYTGDGEPQQITVDIHEDPDPEDSETFSVELMNPEGEAALGTRTSITITILDDDEAQVYLDVADAFDAGTGKSYWLLPHPAVDVPVRLSVAAPAEGAVAGFVTDALPASGTVDFAAGEDTRTVHVDLPEGGAFSNGIWIADRGELTLVSAPKGMELGTPASVVMAWARPAAVRGGNDCVVALQCFILHLFGLGACDDEGRRAGPSPLATLRRYRDEVLAATSVGQYYVDLYGAHSPSMIDALFAAPALAIRTVQAEDPWIVALDALVNGGGASAMVTPAMQAGLSRTLDDFAAAGGPALAAMIATERAKLQLDSVAGLTMTQFQDRIETLGGPQSLRSSTWSRIKAEYRSGP